MNTIRINSLIHEKEFKETMTLLNRVKMKYSVKAFLLFRRIATAAAYLQHTISYRDYSWFLMNLKWFLEDDNDEYTKFLDIDHRLSHGTKLYGIDPKIVVLGDENAFLDALIREKNKFAQMRR